MSATTWGRQRVDVSLNGIFLTRLALSGEGPKEIEIAVPAGALRDVNVLSFELPDAEEDPGAGGRRLGLGAVWLELLPGEPGGARP